MAKVVLLSTCFFTQITFSTKLCSEKPRNDVPQCDATLEGVKHFKGINNSLDMRKIVLLFTWRPVIWQINF